MKRFIRLAALAALVSVLPGCETDQPIQQGTQTLQLRFSAEAMIEFYVDVWDEYRDSNNNGQIDPGDEFEGVLCGDYYQLPALESAQVPWTYAVEVAIIRAGSTTRTLVTPSSAASGYTSATPDDPREFYGETPEVPPPGYGTPGFLYNNGRRVPAESNYRVLVDCLSVIAPEPNLGGGPYPLEIEMFPGDTVVIKAGKNLTGPTFYSEEGGFAASMFLDGLNVTPSADAQTFEPGGRLSFSYTTR